MDIRAKEPGDSATSHHLSVLAELENRIHQLEVMEEEQFGRFTRLDWIICVGGSVILPYACYIWFWP